MEIEERRKTKRMEETELGGKKSGAEEREWKVGDQEARGKRQTSSYEILRRSLE